MRYALIKIVFISVGALFLVVGCASTPEPKDGTTTGQVTANAGPDQTVEDGTPVTLTGSGSDSSGASVSFLWTQTSGTAVALTGQNQATATFTAPTQSGELTFNLLVTSSNGSSNDEVIITVQAAPILFVTNRSGNSISRFRASSTLNGNAAPLGQITGTTVLSSPASMVLDNGSGMLVVNADGNSVVGFPNALTFNGVTPDRNVKGAATLLAQPEGAAYLSSGDLLFVSNFNSTAINVYSNVSEASFTGNIAPTRQILSNTNQIANPRAILHVDSTDELYVVNAGANNITVFANASTAQGLTAASRTITSTEFTNHVLLDAALNDADQLLVVDSSLNRILIFNGASSLGMGSVPAGVLTVPGSTSLTGIVVDSNGTGYVTDSGANAIYIYENIAQLNGSESPPRTVSGPNAQLSGPWHMALLLR